MRGVLVLLALAVILGSWGFWWWSGQVKPSDPANETKVAFVVAKDQTGNQIINNLAEQGLIRSGLAARIYVYVSGNQNRLQAGSFILTRSMTLSQVFTALTGPPADVWVTIPEGWRREQIAARLQATLADVGSASFVTDEFVSATATLEGQLFPDTYLIPVAATASDVMRIMTANFNSKAGLDMPADRRTLVLASLIEREGRSDTDRPVIAGILAKRLKAGWPLQVDATVQYAIASAQDWWPDQIDTKFASPYNTYQNAGLPPTPIANPGLAAIRAATQPAETDYWYYLHAPDGSVYFAKTIAEHNANIDKYLK